MLRAKDKKEQQASAGRASLWAGALRWERDHGSPTHWETHASLGREPVEALTKKWVDGNSWACGWGRVWGKKMIWFAF